MAKDYYHGLVKEALIQEGWTITDDPLELKKLDWDPQWKIDLAAERVIAAEKENQKIAVEVKSFLSESFAYEFHSVIGQYINYRFGLEEVEKDRILYLAVPLEVWNTDFRRKGIQKPIKSLNVKLIIYNTETKEIDQWIH